MRSCCRASSNAATRGLIGRRELALLPPHAVLVNVARGELVDEAALVDALHARRLRGAMLDVTTTEPLPADSPLWSAPNLWITPHMSGGTLESRARSLELLVENLHRYLARDRELLNVVDLARSCGRVGLRAGAAARAADDEARRQPHLDRRVDELGPAKAAEHQRRSLRAELLLLRGQRRQRRLEQAADPIRILERDEGDVLRDPSARRADRLQRRRARSCRCRPRRRSAGRAARGARAVARSALSIDQPASLRPVSARSAEAGRGHRVRERREPLASRRAPRKAADVRDALVSVLDEVLDEQADAVAVREGDARRDSRRRRSSRSRRAGRAAAVP